MTDSALNWLKQNRRARFFLWAHYFDPHEPYDPPEPYKKSYLKDPYAGEIAHMDGQVGRLLDGLKQVGMESRTLVAVIADHGESLGEHGEMTHGVFLYDSTLHVPFILAGPGVPSGKVIDKQVRSIDLMPTVLELAGLVPDAGAQGVTLRPLIDGTSVALDASYSETLYPRIYMGWSELRAVRTDKWKFVIAPRPEFYDLRNDPAESSNVITRFPADAEELRKKVWQIAGDRRREKVAARPADTKTLRDLESLGYVSGGTSGEIQLGTAAADPKDRVEVLKLLTRAENLLGAKDYTGLARVMEQAIRVDSTNPRGHLYLGTAYERMGQYQRAIEVYQHAIAAKVRTDRVYARMGVDYLHLQQFEKAINAMEQAHRLNPNDLNNLLNLGMAYLQLGRLKESEQSFRDITAQNDRFSAAYNGLGLVAVQRGDAETARRQFEKAIEVNPNEVKSLLDLGISVSANRASAAGSPLPGTIRQQCTQGTICAATASRPRSHSGAKGRSPRRLLKKPVGGTGLSAY